MHLTRNEKVTVVVVCCGAFVALLNQTLLSPMLPSIMEDMNIPANVVEWLVTGFMVVSSIVTLANALILEKIPLKKVFSFSFLVFALGSLLMCVSPNFSILLTGRILQAIGSGVLIPTAISTMMAVYPKSHRGKAMGIYGSVTGIGMAIGPSLSGFLIAVLTWRVSFLGIAVFSLILVFAGIIFINNLDFKKNNDKIDIASLILCFTGVSLLLYGISNIRIDKVNWAVVATFVIGLIIVVVFIKRQLSIENPMLNLSILKNKKFRTGTILSTIISSSGSCNAILLPIWIQNCYCLPPVANGLIMLPGTIAAIFLNPIIGRIFDKYGVRSLAILGGSVTTITGFLLCWPQPDLPFAYIVVIWAFRTITLVAVLRVLPTWAINSLPNKHLTHGNTVIVSLRHIFGAIFTAIFVTLYQLVATNTQWLFSGCVDPSINSTLLGINVAFAIQSIICLISTIYILKAIK